MLPLGKMEEFECEQARVPLPTLLDSWTGQKQANAGPAYLPAPTHQTFIHLTPVFMSHKLNAWQVAHKSEVSQIFSPLDRTAVRSKKMQFPPTIQYTSDNMDVTTVIFLTVFISCPGSSVPTLYQWVTPSLDVCDFWDLRPFQPFDKIFYYHCWVLIIQWFIHVKSIIH